MSSNSRPLMSVMMDATSEQVVRAIMGIEFPDARTVLDMTYGSGRFWSGHNSRQLLTYRIFTLDIDPARNPDIVGDFRQLDCRDSLFDVCVFDPPYISNPGKGKPSVMASRFGGYENVAEMEEAIRAGAKEAWRVCRLGILVKVQNHIHGAKLVHMTRWIEEEIPAPLYDEIHAVSNQLTHLKQRERQFSATRNHATYLVFRKGSQYHRERTRVNGR